MKNLTIGIDPDSSKYGVAIYIGGELVDLKTLSVVEFSFFLDDLYEKCEKPVFVIEDVKKNSFIYTRNKKANRAVENRVAQNVGMCKHSQTVAEEFLSHYNFLFIRQTPIRGNWAKNKPQFEKVTGWDKRSNEETRSAAFMGYLYLVSKINEQVKALNEIH